MRNPPQGSEEYCSLWSQTAKETPQIASLSSSVVADVVVVGAGFTGLSTAVHLAQEGGRSVCVLDAEEPGWGASGRNGGQVIPGLKLNPDELLRKFGNERGEAIITMCGGAADTVFTLIERYGIDCDPVRAGWIQPAHNERALRQVLNRAEQWRRRGAPIEVLGRDEVSRRLGTANYVGAWVDRRAGSVQPLSYVRGLARVAQSLGVAVYRGARVTRLTPNAQGWVLETESGHRVGAGKVVIATNGYTDCLLPKLRQTVIAANSFVFATEPLPKALAEKILPGGEVSSDARRLLLYFRKDAVGRLVVGGRGPFREPKSSSDWAHLVRSAGLLYPEVLDIPVAYRWAGRIGLTQDFLPHFHEPAPGLIVAVGYNGRGIAMATQMGKYLAAYLANAQSIPFPTLPIKPIPFHFLNRLYISSAVTWFRFMDLLF